MIILLICYLISTITYEYNIVLKKLVTQEVWIGGLVRQSLYCAGPVYEAGGPMLGKQVQHYYYYYSLFTAHQAYILSFMFEKKTYRNNHLQHLNELTVCHWQSAHQIAVVLVSNLTIKTTYRQAIEK